MAIFDFYKPKTISQWLIFLAANAIAVSSPAGAHLVVRNLAKHIFGNKKLTSGTYQNISQALYKLKKRELVKVIEDGNKLTLVLTDRGKLRKLQYDFELLVVSKANKWDGKWRLLMFDIPESMKKARESFRDKLVKLGFLQFQKSVWIYPYPCNNEIDFIAEILRVAKYITLLTVEIERDAYLRQEFSL